MMQNALWIDTWNVAVEQMLDPCGGPKKVGSELRPELVGDDAADWLLKALNPSRREVLSAAHLIQLLCIGRRNQCDLLAAFIFDQAGYEKPRPIQIEAENARVTAQMSSVMAQMSREMERLQRLQTLSAR